MIRAIELRPHDGCIYWPKVIEVGETMETPFEGDHNGVLVVERIDGYQAGVEVWFDKTRSVSIRYEQILMVWRDTSSE